MEKYSLISSYAAFLLFSFDAFSKNSGAFGYAESAIGMVTYLWQIHFLGITNSQYYTLAIGLYFLVLSYLRRKARDPNIKQLFDIIGTFFLIVPTWFQSLGADGLIYAFILGICGATLLVFGITFTDKWYRYSGILAIVLAVTSRSRWAIIGIAGIAFLIFAIYLLLFRKEDPHEAP
jgi:hypothetical protein